MSKPISEWLNDLGLGQYTAMFKDNDIDWELLTDVDQQTLKDIGVESAGHRLRLLKAIKAIDPDLATTQTNESKIETRGDDNLAGWSRTPGERKPVTMLFADIANSTALTEKLDAEEAHDLLYSATQRMCKAVEENAGTVCRFMGDGIMAMFGAPVSSERHALEACRAALEMQREIQNYSAESGVGNSINLQVRVGLNSGEVVVLEVGDDPDKPEYDASGPTVPLAARMEQSAEAGSILITEATRALAGEFVVVESRDAIAVKGVSRPVAIYRLTNVLSAAAISGSAARQPIVGRKIELAQFDNLLDICLESGYGKTVYIRGEAGIGKTRLVEEITQIALRRGLRQHKALVLDFGAGKGQEAIPSLIRSLLGIASGGNKKTREQALLQAENDGVADQEHRVFLNDLLDLPQPLELRTVYDAMDAESRGSGKRAALFNIVRNLAERNPLLMVVEDLHWADEITLEYLASLAAAVVECASFLVMTSRIEGDPLGKAWRALIGEGPIATWDLGPLRRDESISLVSGFIDASDELAQKCIERAAGNPLFLEQLLLSVQRDKSDSVPDSIKSLILTRIDQLPADDKQALQAASVLGQRFELDALQFLLNDCRFECRNLIEHHLVRPEGSMFLFSHALIQEGSYASLLKRQRLELHQKAAEYYSERDLILYAEHLDQAGDKRVTRAYLDAAKQQSRQYRSKRALQLVERGLEIAPTSESFELRVLQASLMHVLGWVSESIQAYAKAREVANNDSDLCRALIGMAQGMEVTDAHEKIIKVLAEAETIAKSNALNYQLAQIFHIRGGVLFFQSDIDACIETNREALNFARKANSPDVIALALSGLGDAEYGRGHVVSALEYFEECIVLAREHGMGKIIAANMPMKALILAWQNDYLQSLEVHHEAFELAVKTHNLRAEMINLVSGGYIWLYSGNIDKAEESIERSITLARQLGSRLIEGTAHGYLARIKHFQGKPEDACRIASESLEILRQTEAGMTFRAPASLGVLALATEDEEVRQDSWQEAETLLSAGSISHNYFNFYEDAIETCLGLNEWDELDRFADALESYNSVEPLARCTYVVARGRALAAHGRGQRGYKIIEELRSICQYGKEVGLELSLPALETALAET